MREAAERVAFAFLAIGDGASDDDRLDDWRVEAVCTTNNNSRLEHV